MPDPLTVLDEPAARFRYGQTASAPYDGLSLFGPFDTDDNSHPANVRYGVIGTAEGLELFGAFVERLRGPIVAAPKTFSHDIWPPFPGFDAAFCSELPAGPVWARSVDREALTRAAHLGEAHERAFAVVEHYLSELRVARQRDERFGVLFCIVPEEVWVLCRPKSKVRPDRRTAAPLSAKGRALIFAGQQDFLDATVQERFQYSVDFRRQLKARVMEYEVPIQIVRETTLRLSDENVNPNERTLTPLSDRAWNLCATAYYKAGGKPWQLATARPGVCYIGLAFRRAERPQRGTTAVCAAQMFLETGDGIVFKGEYGPWYADEENELHLRPEDAESLLRGVLKTYRDLGGQPLTEVFLHSRSWTNPEEFAGYAAALDSGVRLVGIRVRSEKSDGVKLFRPGTRPVLRGTLWQWSPRSALLWGSGFTPRHRQYVGAEVPVPLRIDIQHGDADVRDVARDIFGLTKLNYNACRLGESEPVTIGFSDAVGEILVANPETKDPQPHFRYYI